MLQCCAFTVHQGATAEVSHMTCMTDTCTLISPSPGFLAQLAPGLVMLQRYIGADTAAMQTSVPKQQEGSKR